MGRKIWIINHYAASSFFSKEGRHYWFAKYLKRKGYEPVIFACNTKHGKKEKWIDSDSLWIEKHDEMIDVPFVFIRSTMYETNGKERIRNMVTFFINTIKTAKEYSKQRGKPDVILASSVHPLTLVAGEKLGKKFNVPCICEVRDLWPFTLVELGLLKNESIIAKALYKGEKWIYSKANQIVFTMKNGKNYILDQGWNRAINLKKIHYINNGIDLDNYYEIVNSNSFFDEDLESDEFKIVYTGAMGPPNQIDMIIDAAAELQSKGKNNIKILLYGDGECKTIQEKRAQELHLENVVFKGRVKREKIPFIISKCDATIITIKNSKLYKYGLSPNKVFEYLAGGKPIICNDDSLRSIIGDKNCALIDKSLSQAIDRLTNLTKDDYIKMCICAKEESTQYSFDNLTTKLIDVIEECF